MKYSEPRFTKDLDLWIATDTTNAESAYAALKEFGAPLAGLSAADFTNGDYFYQMGRAPIRVDIMMSIPGVEFDQAWAHRHIVKVDGLEIPFISRDDLIRAKEASGRPQDLLDVQRLKQNSQLDTNESQ